MTHSPEIGAESRLWKTVADLPTVCQDYANLDKFSVSLEHLPPDVISPQPLTVFSPSPLLLLLLLLLVVVVVVVVMVMLYYYYYYYY